MSRNAFSGRAKTREANDSTLSNMMWIETTQKPLQLLCHRTPVLTTSVRVIIGGFSDFFAPSNLITVFYCREGGRNQNEGEKKKKGCGDTIPTTVF